MSCSLSLAVLFASVLANTSGQSINESLAESSETIYPELWVSDLFYQVLANFSVRNSESLACQKHEDMYEKSLRNHTNWAVKMAESWVRRPIGILTGKRYQFGVYDECVNVNYPVKGQYCISEFKISPTTEKNYISYRKDNTDRVYNSHAWKTILEWINFSQKTQRNMLNIGVCLPDSCTASDLQTSLQIEMNRVFLPKGINVSVKVDQIMCTVKENKYPYDTGFYITSVFFGLLIIFCIGVTFYHYISLSYIQSKNTESNYNYDSVIYSFSLIKSIKELSNYDKDNELNIFNSSKAWTMLFVLFGHRFMYLAGSPLVYTIPLEDIYTDGPNILLTSMNLVDIFFFISGSLMYVTLSPVFKKSGPAWMKIVLPTLYRITRILPAYCAIMAITAHIVPHLGDGPLWPSEIWDEAEKCKNYWWTNLLFINNFISIKYQCLLVSWYIACDIQFFILGIVIVYVYMKNNKYGIGLLITTLGVSLSVPFMITILTKSDGILKVNIPFLENPRSSNVVDELYRPSYMRGIPYFIGLAMGCVVQKLKETKVKFSKSIIFGGTFIIVVINCWIQLYGAEYYKIHRPYYPLEHGLYLVMSHCTWSIITSWILVCQLTTGYGFLAKIVYYNRIMVFLGRLSYSVFLVNLTVIMMSQSSQRTTQQLSVKSVLDAWIFDSFKCYFMGLLLHLIVEAPFGNIVRIMFGRGKKAQSSTNGVSADTSQKNSEPNGTNSKSDA